MSQLTETFDRHSADDGGRPATPEEIEQVKLEVALLALRFSCLRLLWRVAEWQMASSLGEGIDRITQKLTPSDEVRTVDELFARLTAEGTRLQ